MTALSYQSGNPFPLGATPDENGVNFAIYSENATGVELCLFNALEDDIESVKINLKERTNHVWHAWIPGLKPGQLYGFRVHGPYEPEQGHRFNPNKLLIDPYAKAVAGSLQWHNDVFGYQIGDPQADLSFSVTNSSPYIPKCVVIDNKFDWEGDSPPGVPYHESVIYEAHVKGLTNLHPEIPEKIRGTYAAIAHPAIIAHLKKLGITAIELMPVHFFVEDRHLLERGLTNYWGYNTIGFFAPDSRYSSSGITGQQVNEFKEMVKTLHKEGIEVIIDVVYNHTAEGSELGPTICFRGIDNLCYYRHTDNPRYHMDYTGCGNTLNTRMPYVLQLIMDSLRYWITEMHVDGFRFDLAATLARELHEVQKLGAFFDIIHQDPVISRVKLIAEPWDVGEGGFQVGKFPPGWAEWNGLYRDCMRNFWRGGDNQLAEFAQRLTGSSDLYQNDYRNPGASVNFITAHDGFTLKDLVSYEQKHNESNQDDNTDGTDDNYSCNYGIEGETDDPTIREIRSRQQRNMLATVFLSQGVPMLLAGDEIGNSQFGNNNGYCQDNEISWIDWEKTDKELFDFVSNVIALRKKHPAFSRKRWFQGQPIRGIGVEDIAWFSHDGLQMTEEKWNDSMAKTLAVYMNGLGLRCLDVNGEKMTDDHFYLVFNAHDGHVTFTLPEERFGDSWKVALSTNMVHYDQEILKGGSQIQVEPRSFLLLQCPNVAADTREGESLPEIADK